jgi:hypothetical protein
MPQIPASQARAKFTSKMIDLWVERLKPNTFLRKWFPDTPATPTRYVQIEVQRGTKKIAVDVLRNADANYNTFSKSTEKVFDPPYYDENFAITSLDMYDRLMGSGTIDAGIYSYLLEQGTMKMETIVDKIERRYELQRAQVLQTGIVLASATENVDFQRKAGSKLAYNAAYDWGLQTTPGTSDVNPAVSLSTWSSWLKVNGNIGGGAIDLIFGTSAWLAFMGNTFVKETSNFRRINNLDIIPPTMNMDGASFHGQYSDGVNNYNCYTYEQYYTDAAGASQQIIDPLGIIMLPMDTRFHMAYAGVPQLIDGESPAVRTGKFIYYDYADIKRKSHFYGVQSAGLAIPVSVDKIFSAIVTN